MDDLIRRKDAMQRFLKEVRQSGKDHIHINTIKRLLDDVDVAYNVDKVIEEVRNISSLARPVGWSTKQEIVLTKDVIELIKAGGVNE